MQNQFPALCESNSSGFGNIVEPVDTNETAETEKDNEIEELRKQISDMNALKQQLLESEAKLKAASKTSKIAKLKLEHVEKVASQKLIENMPLANFEEDSNHLAMLLATVLEKEDFDYNEDTDKVEPKS